nr:CRTAC1 family protein [Aquimarina sp. MMG016]
MTLFFCCVFISKTFAQDFTLVSDESNPIVSEAPIKGTFFGTSWTDINNDNKLDLFYAGTIFKNLGEGKFETISTDIPSSKEVALNSCSWADYENDGDLDLIFSWVIPKTKAETRIYKNNGNGKFTEVKTILNDIDSATWSTQWCDYNNDSHPDFILTFADKFLGNSHFPNRLYKGNKDGSFTEIKESYEFLTKLAPYTVSNWIDYDEDGDTDLFIASGPAAGVKGAAPDFIYKNLLTETGNEGFQKLTNTELSFSEEKQDGQCYNAVDFDNDGDLDVSLTNYSGTENKLYINNNGKYVKSEAPFTTTNTNNLSNTWADFDNDGDLDILITASSPKGSGYFINNGDGTFTENDSNLINAVTSGNSTGITVGDYDNDGDLDFFVVGGSKKSLFQNNLKNDNGWVNFKLIGTKSNKAALGARLQLTSNINGKIVTQKREISASNTFMGHNSLRAHFGLANSSKIDELIINWPSGAMDTFKNLDINKFYTLEEGSNTPKSSIE